jgi:hypothetical protein
MRANDDGVRSPLNEERSTVQTSSWDDARRRLQEHSVASARDSDRPNLRASAYTLCERRWREMGSSGDSHVSRSTQQRW